MHSLTHAATSVRIISFAVRLEEHNHGDAAAAVADASAEHLIYTRKGTEMNKIHTWLGEREEKQ